MVFTLLIADSEILIFLKQFMTHILNMLCIYMNKTQVSSGDHEDQDKSHLMLEQKVQIWPKVQAK